MVGVNNTKEVLRFVTALGVLIGEEVSSDGLQASDVLKLFEDQQFKAKLAAAIKDVSLIRAELSDLSITDTFEVGMEALKSAREIMAAFEKKAA